jgi:hypothetical protein
MQEKSKFHSSFSETSVRPKTYVEFSEVKVFRDLSEQEAKVSQKIFDAVVSVYTENQVDLLGEGMPRIVFGDREMIDKGYFDFTRNLVVIREFDELTIAHEIAHSLGAQKEYYGRYHEPGSKKYDMHARSGFSQITFSTFNSTSFHFFWNIDEAVKALVSKYALEKLGIKTNDDSYLFETKALLNIFSVMKKKGVENPFKLFLTSDRNGWSKELKSKLIELFGGNALKVLNFDYKILRLANERVRRAYMIKLIDFFSLPLTLLSENEKYERGQKILDYCSVGGHS